MSKLSAFRLNFRETAEIFALKHSSKSFQKQNVSVNALRWMTVKGGHRPNILDKYILVWMKKYPSVSEVPTYVSPDMMEKSRNWARIKINIICCILTGIVCVFMVYSGKQAAKRGESLTKMNLDWHKEQNAKKD